MPDTPIVPNLEPASPKESTIQEVVKEIPVIVDNTSSLVNNIKIIVIVLGAIFIILGVLKGCSCFPHIPFKIGDTTIKDADPTKPAIITATYISYTPKNGKPVKVSKPVEGKVTIENGTIKIQNSGLVFVPKLGAIYSFGDKDLEWTIGARLIFVSSFGFEAMLNDRRLFAGIDFRDPILNSLTTSVGLSTPYKSLGQISPYLGEEVTLLSF